MQGLRCRVLGSRVQRFGSFGVSEVWGFRVLRFGGFGVLGFGGLVNPKP